MICFCKICNKKLNLSQSDRNKIQDAFGVQKIDYNLDNIKCLDCLKELYGNSGQSYINRINLNLDADK